MFRTLTFSVFVPLRGASLLQHVSLDGETFNVNGESELGWENGLSNDAPFCGLWLAPSTIEGAGLGMYAGRSYQEDEFFQNVGDLLIPIVDIEAHAWHYSRNEWKFPYDDYTWDGSYLRMDNEGAKTVHVASSGIGSVANSFLTLVNVDEWPPFNDVGGLHRSKDPGVGAFSPYYDRKASASREIEAGEELFVSYGSGWFKVRDQLKAVPLYGDLDLATELAQNLFALEDRVPDNVIAEIWNTFAAKSRWQGESRVLGAFHFDDSEELELLKSKTMKQIRVDQSKRSINWLEEHGTCADHIQARQSTIRQAGRGGFASRNLPAGTIVSHLPLLHITDRGRLSMYSLRNDEPDSNSMQLSGYQLLLNYCFGHGESTLLLCPYGTMADYVNHNSSKANVKIRWANPKLGKHTPSMLNKSLEALESDYTVNLAFEMVALRDINEGEELFLDYGYEWEHAWQEHTATWRPPKGSSRYVPAWKINAETILTELEGVEYRRVKYPANIELRCDRAFLDLDNEVLEEQISSNSISRFLAKLSEPLLPCEINNINKKDGKLRYTVTMWEENGEVVKHVVEDVPREGLVFRDRPYTSDIFVKGAFRHDIRIPDDIFPDAWRNLKNIG